MIELLWQIWFSIVCTLGVLSVMSIVLAWVALVAMTIKQLENYWAKNESSDD